MANKISFVDEESGDFIGYTYTEHTAPAKGDQILMSNRKRYEVLYSIFQVDSYDDPRGGLVNLNIISIQTICKEMVDD